MPIRPLAILLALTGLACLPGCDRGQPPATAERAGASANRTDAPAPSPNVDSADAPAAASPADLGTTPPQPTTEVTLTTLGLTATVPAGSTVNDAIMGKAVVLRGPQLMATVEAVSATRPETLADATHEAESFEPTEVQSKTLADGWALSFSAEGGLGRNHFVQVRRTIGAQTIWCETTASTAAQGANALACCMSLQPAG